MTVAGPISSAELGITLMHEHLTVRMQPSERSADAEVAELLDAPVTPSRLALLREHPYASRENGTPPSLEASIAEVAAYAARGGRTIVENTGWNIGRDPDRLASVSAATGVSIVMGTGPYLERTHPDRISGLDATEIADLITSEWRDGVSRADGPSVRPGIIGEIGVSVDFTSRERTALRGASMAQLATRMPLMVHLPAWRRVGHEVLDEVEAAGVDPRAVILAHMDPSFADVEYQRSVAARGAHVEFDGIGMGINFPGEGEQPSDAQIAGAVLALVEAGHVDRILLSHDLFLRIQLQAFGGNGLSHVLRSFLPRLVTLGMAGEVARGLMVDNPRLAFEEAAAGSGTQS